MKLHLIWLRGLWDKEKDNCERLCWLCCPREHSKSLKSFTCNEGKEKRRQLFLSSRYGSRQISAQGLSEMHLPVLQESYFVKRYLPLSSASSILPASLFFQQWVLFLALAIVEPQRNVPLHALAFRPSVGCNRKRQVSWIEGKTTKNATNQCFLILDDKNNVEAIQEEFWGIMVG